MIAKTTNLLRNGNVRPIFADILQSTFYILRFKQPIILENLPINTFFFTLTYRKNQEFDENFKIYEKGHTNKEEIENLNLLTILLLHV